jgi:hypothetical protein
MTSAFFDRIFKVVRLSWFSAGNMSGIFQPASVPPKRPTAALPFLHKAEKPEAHHVTKGMPN